MNIDEKTGRTVETPASNDFGFATNIDVSDDDKLLSQKFIQMQSSSSLPDLQTVQGTSSSPSSTGTVSSNSNNQIQSSGSGHGKHVILTVEAQDDDSLNQMNVANGSDGDHLTGRKKIKLNIGVQSDASSSSTSSNNLENGLGTVSNTSTL